MSWFSGKVNGMPDFGQGDGWTASEWRRAPRRNVPVRKLVSTNRGGYLNKAKAAKYSSGGGGDPYVVECNGRYYVADGHHRIYAAAARGERTIKVRIMRAG